MSRAGADLRTVVLPGVSKNRAKQRDKPLMWLIWEAFQFSRRSFDEALRPHGVSGTQLSVLNRIAQQPGLSGSELSRLMLTTPQAAQLTLASLERKGLIERRADVGNGHVVRSNLTEEGRRVVNSCEAEVHAVERRLLTVLSPDEQRSLSALLRSYLRQSPDSV